MRGLGSFELLVLLAVMRLGPFADGTHIYSEILTRGGCMPRPATVYTTLRRLEKKKCLTSQWTLPLPEPGGRSCRCYTVTPKARRKVALRLRALRRMSEGVALPDVSTPAARAASG